jgi:hypothetical protein
VRPGPWNAIGIVAADFTRDGKVDAAVLSAQWETVSVLPGLGDGTLGSEMRSAAGRRPVAFAAGDFDADGGPDLVTADMGLRDAWVGSLPDLYVLLNRTPASNQAPIAIAMAPAAVECSSWSGAVVRLDGSASHDPDSRPGGPDDLESFAWYEGFGTSSETFIGSGRIVDVTLGLGAHAITLLVTDRAGLTGSAATTVTVQDSALPAIELRPIGPGVLWPPDHRMVVVEVSAVASDRCGPVEVALQSVTSNEPDDAPGAGDGHTIGDVRGVEIGRPDFAFQLRAERSGAGEGRKYTARYRAIDGSGRTADAAIVVTVPAARPPAVP